MKPTIISDQMFYGGISVDDNVGIEHSHAYSRSADFRKKPGQLSPLAATRRIGSNNIVDLIQQIIQVDDGTRYGLGDQGYFYSIDNSNNVVVKGKLDNGAAGMLYRKDLQEMYMSSTTTVSYYGKFSTPTLQVNKYGVSVSTDDAATSSGGLLTYAVPIAITESASTIQEFEADIEPLVKIRVRVATKGTGNWTLTLHDDANNVLATSTVATANITSAAYLEFTFSSQVRLYVKPSARTYHFHLTSTVADGTVYCGTASNLNTCDFDIYADRLVNTNNGLHPMAQFLQYVCIGNGRYLTVWEPLSDNPSNLEWLRHRLDFGDGFEVCSLTPTDEYLMIAVERRSTSNTRTFQEGRIFAWDGLSEAHNFSIEVKEGAPEGMFTYQNLPYMIVNGALYVWPGGKNLVKLRTLLNTDSEFSNISDSTRVYPNIMGVRRGVLVFGYPSITGSVTMEHGVFSWGAIDKNFPMSFGYNYVISTGTKLYNGSAALRIGTVRSFGDSLYVSWCDDSQPAGFRYGLDVVDNSSAPAAAGTWESRIYDAQAVFKQKIASRMKLTCEALPANVTIRMKYKIDRGSWVYPEDGVLTEGDTYKVARINSRNHEIQRGFDWESTASTPFVVTSMALDVDLLTGESPFTETT
jgi:hypothetical protein